MIRDCTGPLGLAAVLLLAGCPPTTTTPGPTGGKVDLAFDLGARRAAIIPEALAARERERFHPELDPQRA